MVGHVETKWGKEMWNLINKQDNNTPNYTNFGKQKPYEGTFGLKRNS